MAGLMERFLGSHPTDPKIPAHAFSATAGEWARGVTAGQVSADAQAQSAIRWASGDVPLKGTQITDAQAIVALVTTKTDPAARALEVIRIDHVLLQATHGVPGYATPTDLAARLGITIA